MIKLEELEAQEDKIEKLRNKSYKLSSDLQEEEKKFGLLCSQFMIESNLIKSIDWTLSKFEYKYNVKFWLVGAFNSENKFLSEYENVEIEKSINLCIYPGISCFNIIIESNFDSNISFSDFQNFIKKYEIKIIGHDLEKEFKEITEKFDQMQYIEHIIKG